MTYAEALHVVGRAMRAGITVAVGELDAGPGCFGVLLQVEGAPVAFEHFSEAQLELDLVKLAE